MKENMLYKNKMGMFDLIKGIAIFGVVFHHTIVLWDGEEGFGLLILMSWALGLCWMPVFLLSSAYWYKLKPIKPYTKSQMSNLMIPFLYMEVVLWVCYSAIHYAKWGYFRDTLKGLSSVVLGAVLGNMTEIFIGDIRICDIGPMWFVLTLCFSGIIFNCIMIQEKIKNKFVLILLLTVVGIGCIRIPWQFYCFSGVLVALFGHYVGYKLKKTKFLIRQWDKKDYVYILGAIIIYVFVLLVVYLCKLYKPTAYVIGIPLGVLALRVGLKLGQMADNCITLFFKRLGRYTFWILMVHTVEMLSIDWRWLKDWHILAGLPPFINFLIVLLVRLCLIAFGCYCVAKLSKVWTRIRENVISKRIVRVEK